MVKTALFNELTEKSIFTASGEVGDVRATAFWRVGDLSTGAAIQVRLPQLADVEVDGVKSGTFFRLKEEVKVIFTRP